MYFFYFLRIWINKDFQGWTGNEYEKQETENSFSFFYLQDPPLDPGPGVTHWVLQSLEEHVESYKLVLVRVVK